MNNDDGTSVIWTQPDGKYSVLNLDAKTIAGVVGAIEVVQKLAPYLIDGDIAAEELVDIADTIAASNFSGDDLNYAVRFATFLKAIVEIDYTVWEGGLRDG